jgi:hypothetical protein
MHAKLTFVDWQQWILADKAIFEREDLPRAYRRLVQALA